MTTDPMISRFEELRAGFNSLLAFRYVRAEPQGPPNIEMEFGGDDGAGRLLLSFEAVQQVEMQAHSGNWFIEVVDISADGWQDLNYRVVEIEGNDGEDVKFYARSFSVHELDIAE